MKTREAWANWQINKGEKTRITEFPLNLSIQIIQYNVHVEYCITYICKNTNWKVNK